MRMAACQGGVVVLFIDREVSIYLLSSSISIFFSIFSVAGERDGGDDLLLIIYIYVP